jgi:hypothetical protein
MTDRTTPPSCALPPEALRARIAELRARIAPLVREVRTDGAKRALRFDRNPDTIRELGELVAFESQCCGPLGFRLEVGRDDGPVWLTVLANADDAAALDAIFGTIGTSERSGS